MILTAVQTTIDKTAILPENDLPDVAELLAEGERLARINRVSSSSFSEYYQVGCEAQYKKQCMDRHQVMFHGQIGYRSLEKSLRAYSEIFSSLDKRGYRIDRYGICLDWSMGYPANERRDKPKGTGLILNNERDFQRLSHAAPVAAHFGDFVIGMPAAIENTLAVFAAGATSIGNLGQYFTFRLPHYHNDVTTTKATVVALKLAAAQPVEVLIHSNLDDGFAALFSDISCALGAVLIEQYIVETLIGGHMSHCYGHTFSHAPERLAFQRALAKVSNSPGTMVYGNTTIYGSDSTANYASLASYLMVDIMAQQSYPSGHALNPVPVTEALRIPEIDEIVDAHIFANRLLQRSTTLNELYDVESVNTLTEKILSGGEHFKSAVLSGLSQAGFDVRNPFELLLALRRIGARKLEALFGPGSVTDQGHRIPTVKASPVTELEINAAKVVDELTLEDRQTIRDNAFTACCATTDVHEYGKMLLEEIFSQLGIATVNGGVSVDADQLAQTAKSANADFIAVSTYNGVALNFMQQLRTELNTLDFNGLVFVGGKLNQIVEENQNDLPVDVSASLSASGVIACSRVEDLLKHLLLTLEN